MASATPRVRVSLNQSAIQKTMGGASDRILHQTSREVVRYARLYAPVGRTGRLARSIKAGPIKKSGVRTSQIQISASTKGFGNGAQKKDYAGFVHHGTYGPITPRRAKALAFQAAGTRYRRAGRNASQAVRRRTLPGTIIRKSVRGQKAQPFLTEALDLMAATDPRVRRLR